MYKKRGFVFVAAMGLLLLVSCDNTLVQKIVGLPKSSDKEIIRFDIAFTEDDDFEGATEIDSEVNLIEVTLPTGTTSAQIKGLYPVIEHTGVSVEPVSRARKDFTDPQIYTVTAEDGSTREYTVSVEVAAP